MVSVFLDSNIIYSAVFAPQSKPAKVLTMAIESKIQSYVSLYVLEEVNRNIKRKIPDRTQYFNYIIDSWENCLLAIPTFQQVRNAMNYCEPKDAPVVAAAIKANVDFLVTGDKKHLIKPKQVAEKSGLNIITPSDFLVECDVSNKTA